MARSSPRARGAGIDRRLLVVSVAFGLFVLCDIVLFGWLIFRSLSQREIEQVLLETRHEAETLADQIAHQLAGRADLYTAIAVEHETQTYIDSIPRQRDIVRSVEIRDKQGRLVFQSRTDTSAALAPEVGPLLENPEVPPDADVVHETHERSFPVEVPDIEVAIGDLGTLVIGISPEELSKRIGVLRRHLMQQTALVALLTVALLTTAYTAIWRLYQRSRRLEIQAVEAERLAYLGTLASGLAHEIRNPLNSLNLNMQMMQEEIASGQGEGPTAGRLLSITRSEISRLERLVTDFLSYARPRPPELEEVTPRELFERVREVLAGDLQNLGARLRLHHESDGARVRADVAQLTQLLLNLVQNGLAAAREGGHRPEIDLRARRRDGELVLEVEDNGPGVPDEERGRIFDLFYSTRKGGTGLGLAIVQRIAENHDGRVEVESEPGAGSVFRVVLPLPPEDGAA